MRYALAILLAIVVRLAFTQRPAVAQEDVALKPRFEAVHVYVDSGGSPLGAYQVQLSDRQGRVQVVGVENGEHAAFGKAPFYDRTAVNQGKADRIIIAAYSTLPADQLPTGKTRMATVHLRVMGQAPADYQIKLIAAADAAGNDINATVSLDPEH